jgi:hypothetical protein
MDSTAKNIYLQRIAPGDMSLPSFEEVFTHICTEPIYATIVSSYITASLQATDRIRCNITAVSEASFVEYLSMPIAKGCPYTSVMNYKSVALVQVVVIYFWFLASFIRVHISQETCLHT